MGIFESLDLDEHEVQMEPGRTTVTAMSMSGMLTMRNVVSLGLFQIARFVLEIQLDTELEVELEDDIIIENAHQLNYNIFR